VIYLDLTGECKDEHRIKLGLEGSSDPAVILSTGGTAQIMYLIDEGQRERLLEANRRSHSHPVDKQPYTVSSPDTHSSSSSSSSSAIPIADSAGPTSTAEVHDSTDTGDRVEETTPTQQAFPLDAVLAPIPSRYHNAINYILNRLSQSNAYGGPKDQFLLDPYKLTFSIGGDGHATANFPDVLYACFKPPPVRNYALTSSDVRVKWLRQARAQEGLLELLELFARIGVSSQIFPHPAAQHYLISRRRT